MSPLFQSLGIDRLSIDERLVLVTEIWDSIAEGNAAVRTTEEQKQEIRRRIAEHLSNPDDSIPWEQIEEETRARLKL
ncbi:MAG: addiction module protein [Pirellulales bacterium]